MKPKSLNEEELRLCALYDYGILDTEHEEVYDQLTELVATICEVPFTVITIVDEKREWFKSCYGFSEVERPRGWLFYPTVNSDNRFFEINDTSSDLRFNKIPALLNGTEIVFYAGVAICNANDQHLATLTVMGEKPSSLSKEQKRQLEILANQVLYLLELRKSQTSKEELLEQIRTDAKSLESKNKQLEEFVYSVSHDLQAPLITISAFSKKIAKELEVHTNEQQKHRFNRIEDNIVQMSNLLKDLLELSRIISKPIEKEWLDTESLITNSYQQLAKITSLDSVNLVVESPLKPVFANELLLTRCIFNIFNFFIQNNHKTDMVELNVSIKPDSSHISLFIKDNELNLTDREIERAFCIFEQVENQKGTGMGLCIVKAALDKHDGEVKLTSPSGEGTQFQLNFPIVNG